MTPEDEALLGATLFGFVGLAMVWDALADRLRWSSHAALRTLAHPLVTRGIYLAALAVMVAAWVVAAFGGSSPAWLVALLGLGH
jgi:hypothetical protein